MKSGNLSLKVILLVAGCGIGLWKLGVKWFGPAVEPGKVTILTSGNFREVQREAKTLVALYMRPG
jgi:hypothetical protein